MPARDSNGLRVFIALLGTVVPLAPGLVSGCGSSAATPPAAMLGTDAAIPLGTVVTGGGGASTSSSSSGAIRNPFGDLPMPDSGSSSEGGSSSGSSSGDGSNDGSVSDGAPPSDASDSGPVGSPANMCANYVVPMCGATPCDLRSNTCCVSLTYETRCLPNPMPCDPMKEASIHCLQACECPGDGVCCGVANTIVGAVQSECQAIPDGGLCNPHPQTNTQASEQLCGTDGECKTGQACLKQTCEFGVTLNICGLQSQAPFDCHL